MRRPFVFLAVLVIAAGADAALGKHKDWLESAEAQFLTAGEREEWQRVRSDQEAEAFIAAFVARRGGLEFTRIVRKRVANADAMFGHDDVKGSDTLRGKLVILFGTPRSIDISPAQTARSNAGRSLGGAGRALPRDNTSRSAQFDRVVTLTFALEGKEYVVHVEVDTGSGKDRLAKEMDDKQFDALIDAVTAASVVKP